MIYGQAMFDNKLRSLASSLDIVAHELFHGVTAATARLIYQDEPGALNESYSDIFGALISNSAQPEVMTARAGDGFLFKPEELAAMFYVALTQQLSRVSTFSDSRRGVVIATRSLFRKLPQADIDALAAAVEAGFDAAGIK
jgi:Zn-dependent metalloprotease